MNKSGFRVNTTKQDVYKNLVIQNIEFPHMLDNIIKILT